MIYASLSNPWSHGAVSKWGEVKTISFSTVCVSTLQRHLEDAFILWRGEAIGVIVSISAQITPKFQEASSSTCA
jgi:hypothetical protein